jgi:hypothetical protein
LKKSQKAAKEAGIRERSKTPQKLEKIIYKA